jgi:guanylate kinase
MDEQLRQSLVGYQPSDTAKQLIKDTPILLLVGPTGAGKDSVKDELLKTGRFHHIVSHTTRPPRINHGVIEQDGREYHFVDGATAKKMLDEQAFIEAKIYSGNLYGTSVAEIQSAHNEGKTAMTDLEVQGVAEYKALDPGVMAVFLLPPDFRTWQQRLQRRYGDVVDVADYRLRLQTALQELEQLLNTDYYVAVINDDLATTVKRIEEVVDSRDHTAHDEPAARQVAGKLAENIKDYLTQTSEV